MVPCIGGDVQIELSQSPSHCPVFRRVADPAILAGISGSGLENFRIRVFFRKGSERNDPGPKKTVAIFFFVKYQKTKMKRN